MRRRYLFGPVTATFADQNLRWHREAGDCLAFAATEGVDLRVAPTDSWEAVCERLPPGWRPDFIALYLPYTTVPHALWSAPVPLVALAPDYNLQWHHYRYCLPRGELVLTDAPGAAALAQAGIGHARAANLFGCSRALLEGPWHPQTRDIDILFVGNLNQAVQSERLP
jgi:hypothetical protein